jgi:hypothetical protein
LTPDGLSPRTLGGVSRGLALTSSRVARTLLHLSLMSLLIPRDRVALLKVRGLFLPHAGRGMSTVSTWSEWCASSGSKGNSSGTRYPPQSTSHKSSVVNPVGLQPPPQGLEGKMPPLEGVNPRDFEADDSNTGRDGHMAPHHRLDPWGPSPLCPYPFCGLKPF